MNCDFTETHYQEILKGLQARGYRFCSYADLNPGARFQVVLRHDVDLSLKEALRIARIDADLGVSSVFHLLLTAEVYNLVSATGKTFLSELRRLGHRIGLHVDLETITRGQAGERFYDGLERLFRLAEHILGLIDSFSLHRPTARGKVNELHPNRIPFQVPPYAYADEYHKAILYRSDSRREWHDGCLCGQIESLRGHSLQLVLHPIWWPAESCMRENVLKLYRKQQQAAVNDYLTGNLSFYTRPRLPD